MYDAQAGSIKVKDITANVNSWIVMDRIKRNNPEDDDVLYIQNHHDCNGKGCVDYVPEGVYDMGWLGYFISKNNHLDILYMRDFEPPSGASVMEVLEPFIMGVNKNKSITGLDVCMDLLGGRVFSMMCPFFENNKVLTSLTIRECRLDDDGWRLLALALGRCKNKSLTHVSLSENDISDGALVDIITALSMHPRLQQIDLTNNFLNEKGCRTLATLLRCSCTELEHLDLDDNEINDKGIDALVPALKNCSHLTSLSLENNSITTKGCHELTSILEVPNLNFVSLYIVGNNIDDEVVNAFTSTLVNNHMLETLRIWNYHNHTSNSSITDEGWKVLSNLLCDTSSINSTDRSNHTLNHLGTMSKSHPLKPLLALNKVQNKKEVAIIKILQNHNEFDMTPFFEWEFKVLPLIVDWFERASSIKTKLKDFEPKIGTRKLSSIYQFVRGMPLLYVETRLRKELEDIKAAQAQMEQAMRLNEERKRVILDRLGRNI